MTVFKRFGFLLVCTALLIPKMSSAQTQGMTYEEYEAKLAQHQKRQAGTNKQVAECQAAGYQGCPPAGCRECQAAGCQECPMEECPRVYLRESPPNKSRNPK